MELIEKFSKKASVEIKRNGRDVLVVSYDGVIDYEEIAPAFHETYWAAWWAFRLLHPDKHVHFEIELRKMFEDFKKTGSARKWASYNDEKRLLLERYLRQPYSSKKRKKKK